MQKQKLKIHQWIQDNENWRKYKALCYTSLVPFQRLRNNNAELGKSTLDKFIEIYVIISKDFRDPIEIKLDLLSPVEDSISG